MKKMRSLRHIIRNHGEYRILLKYTIDGQRGQFEKMAGNNSGTEQSNKILVAMLIAKVSNRIRS